VFYSAVPRPATLSKRQIEKSYWLVPREALTLGTEREREPQACFAQDSSGWDVQKEVRNRLHCARCLKTVRYSGASVFGGSSGRLRYIEWGLC